MTEQARQAALANSPTWADVEGAKITVVGLGKSGLSAANALARRGAHVLAVDDLPEHKLADSLNKLHPRVEVQVGQPDGPVGRRGDIFVISPGVAPHSRRFRDIHSLSHAVLSEVELFYRLDRALNHGAGHPIAAISGTDGKTTTTLWTAHLLAKAGINAVVGGNIGDPLCDFVDTLEPNDVVVAEVSAFQLLTCSLFRPRTAVVTNIAHDHLDYFSGDLAKYVQTKVKVADNMGPGDTLLINGDDAELELQRARLRSGVPFAWLPFTTQGVPDRGFGFDGKDLWLSLSAEQRIKIMAQSELGLGGKQQIGGIHNVENALGAVGMAMALGAPLDAIRQGLRDFSLPSHRIEFVGSIGGVRFIDDSKATNPHAAIAGLTSVSRADGEKLVWIGGGSDKESDFTELAGAVAHCASAAILIGQTAGQIQTALGDTIAVHRCERLEEAVALGLQIAAPAGVVLLSPACASFDMFKSYAHRGDVFATAVARLQAAVAQVK